MSDVTEFIELYNRLDDYLRALTHADEDRSFSALLVDAAPKSRVVNNNRTRLSKYGLLRNILVHGSEYPRRTIAVPTPEALQDFRSLVTQITSPKRLIPMFRKVIRPFGIEENLTDAIAYMREYDFSQVVVRREGHLALLTVEGIARWFAEQATTELVSVIDTRVGDAFAHEDPKSFLLMRENKTVDDAYRVFATAIDHKRPRLFAIIVTVTGNDTETPLGLVTPWDLLN